MRKILILVLLIGTFLTACAPATPPPPTPDTAATVQALSATMVAATLTAMPTATTIPTDTPPPSPTATLVPLFTDTPVSTATAIPTEASTAAPFTGCFTPNGTTNLTAPFKIENMTKVAVTVYINGVTTEGDHTVNCSYTVDPGGSTIFTIWFGNYSYWSVGKKTLSGTFWVNDSDKATMQVTDKNIKIGPFP